MIALLAAACALAALYQCLACFAAVRQLLRREPPAPAALPPISILKPVRGLDPGFEAAIQSHAEQDYPEFEILFGVRSLDDPAVPSIRELMARYPDRVRLVECRADALNAKVGVLIDLAAQARHGVLLVSDADIEVPPRYLRRLAAALAVPGTGVVTCLYAPRADSLPGLWEAAGIAADFAPSVLVAPLAGVREFGLGSTLCFRRAHLEAIGGFAAIRDYLADDYQLAKRITGLGLRSVLSKVVVATHVNDSTWAGVWQHQERWARTIRVSRGGGYLGLPVTHAGLWALLAASAGLPMVAAALAALRIASGLLTGAGVLGRWWLVAAAPLLPLWDLWAFGVWVAGLSGGTAVWRGQRLRLTPDGRIRR